MPSGVVQVLLVDDHKVVRTGLRILLESFPGVMVIGEAGNRAEAMAAATEQKPDIILLDLDLGDDENGLDFIPDLLEASNARILVLTGVRDPEAHRRALGLGARGVVPAGGPHHVRPPPCPIKPHQIRCGRCAPRCRRTSRLVRPLRSP